MTTLDEELGVPKRVSNAHTWDSLRKHIIHGLGSLSFRLETAKWAGSREQLHFSYLNSTSMPDATIICTGADE